MGGVTARSRKNSIAKELMENEVDKAVLESKLGYHVRMLDRHMSKEFNQKIGMTQVQFSVFSLVATNENLSQVAIGEALGMDRASTMAIVHKLEEAGLLMRRKSALDRRVHALQLTEKGRKDFVKFNKKVTEYDAMFSSRLTKTEMENFSRYLKKIMS